MHPESEDIKQENNVDKYASRPHILKNMCLADFIALTDTIYNTKNKEIQSADEMSIDENTSDEEYNNVINDENEIDTFHKLFPIKLQNNKIIKFRKHRKVIRFVNYKL